MNDVVGNVFLAAACVAYFGAFTAGYRAELVASWIVKCQDKGIPVSENLKISDVLSSPFQIRQWNATGLPRDMLSTENAVLVTCGRRWPLMIDPQDQANNWVRQMEGPNGLKVIKLTEPTFLRTLENAIRIGTPVLLEEVGETLDPSLETILLKQTFKQNGRLLIRIGDSDVDYDVNFRFYMTTKMANPHYLPEICIKVTIINFTVTKAGLEDQLLSDVVRLERPDLEEKRSKLILQINEDKNQLKGIEDKILKLLFNSQGMILDNEVLINTLNDSKTTSGAIGVRLEQAEKTEASITEARDKYKPVAIRGSVLFFAIADLGLVDPMYQYSLKYFKKLFNLCITQAVASTNLDTRLNNIISFCSSNIYSNVSRGLFEIHKLMFSFMITAEILKQRGGISFAEYNFFLRGCAPDKLLKRTPKPAGYPGLSVDVWNAVSDLENTFPDVFQGLTPALLQPTPFAILLGTVRVQSSPGVVPDAPSAWDENLSSFQKVMLVRALADHLLTRVIGEFVVVTLDKSFVESPPVELATLYKDLSSGVPLVFVLSVGSDPMSAFLRFGAEMNMMERYHAISLGQGQGPIAERLIAEARKKGDWIFLQNCHLAKSWMNNMEIVIKSLNDPAQFVHDDFRLFLSSAPCDFFPVSVLQNSVKVTNEPPKGLRANVRRAFTSLDKEAFEAHFLGDTWRKLVFGLCFFHAIIQERKKFGPLGWNIKYEFSNSDRETALETLRIQIGGPDQDIPFDALEFLTGEIVYGGRVTDSWDQRCLRTVLRRFFNRESLQPAYTYSGSGIYYPIASPVLSDYLLYVESLPFSEDPEVFGMHDNANLLFLRSEADNIVRTVLDVQPRLVAAGDQKSPDDLVLELAESILIALPKVLFDTDLAKPGTFDMDANGRVDSLSTVLRQEIDRFNALLRVLWSSLTNVKKAIKGFVVMSSELELIHGNFLNGQVPKMWEKAAYPSLKPLASWVKDLGLRLEFIDRWLKTGLPRSFWLSGFFFPQGFLTGVLQNYARKYQKPIDTLTFKFDIGSVAIDQTIGDADVVNLPALNIFVSYPTLNILYPGSNICTRP